MTTHELKCWPAEFNAVWCGIKRHEIRIADRNYAVGDILVLQEYAPVTNAAAGPNPYSGRWMRAQVTYLTGGGSWGLPSNICVMSVQVSERHLAVEPSEYNKSHGPTTPTGSSGTNGS